MPETLVRTSVEQVSGFALVERRRAGEVFPRVPFGPHELTREQVATALFLDGAKLSKLPDNWELLNVLAFAVNDYGVAGLDARLPELDARSDTEAHTAWAYAYRLCLAHWYENATAVLVSPSVMTAALYASDLAVQRDKSALGKAAELDGHMAEGIARIGTDRAVELAEAVKLEFGYERVSVEYLPDEYREAMPDRRRRKHCYRVAVNRQMHGMRPLLVHLDNGHHAIGITPPECPYEAEFDRAAFGGTR
ncbi:hypothetical protein ACIQPP_01910 [Streptomyces violaceusniger]|uniref:hypothetical protein n=1 Tax=Streptomyces violaceusniger TaxID=68280 RepID=UPI0009C3B57B|nr:hypothetical protein [Streptomyces hygroscopicus]AQW53409.1 hypothetical protein SHXM_06872 [Streptomyces hygroscopicus]